MLFMVHMDVQVPHDFDAAEFAQLKAAEKIQAEELQRSGKWRHLWRIVGQYANVSIFDVNDPAELHDIMMSLPLFPFMTIEVTALCRHPSAINQK
ncbi:muconolactone Delta-isomerase [Parasphingorhabdus sp.]|uniref:muconolactone Delta-isomerase n=1 Tax=Parasphingorhabdus sp. TaxID=2709688 RepID=UPI003A8FF3CD